MKASDLIDQAANNQGLSHAKLAKMIQLTPGSLSNLRTGKGELSDDTYVKLAKLAGVDPVQILIEKHARKAGPEAAPLWRQIQKHLPKSAALLLVVVLITPCKQSHETISKFSKLSNVYYVKFYFWVCQMGEKTTNTLLMLTQKEKHEARKYHTHQAIW